jgi:hypothetical protein
MALHLGVGRFVSATSAPRSRVDVSRRGTPVNDPVVFRCGHMAASPRKVGTDGGNILSYHGRENAGRCHGAEPIPRTGPPARSRDDNLPPRERGSIYWKDSS